MLKLQGEVIAGKSYYSHSIEVTPVSICQLFTKVELAYKEYISHDKDPSRNTRLHCSCLWG